MSNAPPVPLDYAPPRRASWRKWLARIAIGAIVLSIPLLLYLWWPAITDRWAYWQAQRQCFRYTAPSDRVVFTTRSKEAKALQNLPNGYHGAYLPGRFDIAGFEPPELMKLRGLSTPYFVSYPRQNVAFMHELISPAGNRRLVILSADATGGGRVFGFWRSVLKPVSLISSRQHNFSAMMPGMFESDGDFRVFAGQADPNDASHFTIRFELAGQAGLIDGRLNNNDRIILTVREGPPANVIGENAQQE